MKITHYETQSELEKLEKEMSDRRKSRHIQICGESAESHNRPKSQDPTRWDNGKRIHEARQEGRRGDETPRQTGDETGD